MTKKSHILTKAVVVVMIFIQFGCETHYLSKSSKEYIPYQIGDMLIFQKNNKQIDTLWITEIEKYVNPDDPLDVFPTRYQTMFVSGEISMREIKKDIYDRPITRRFQQVLEIESDKDGDDHFLFVFDNKNEPFINPRIAKKLSELKNCLNNVEYSCEIAVKESYSLASSEENDLVSFNWSKYHGYKKFKYLNGDEYELIEFWRNKKNILN